jgi:hypothetical protein
MKVKGLETFARYFSSFDDCYCLIGGSALSLIYEKQALSSRSTKDLDIVVLLSGKTPSFLRELIRFVQEGKYKEANVSPDYCSYRFADPQSAEFPKQVELFTKEKSIGSALGKGIQHLSTDAEVSFSSIVLDPIYYDYIASHTQKGKITYISDYAIVPLKAKAYLENKRLFDLKTEGIHEETYKKHARDVLRFVRDFPLKKTILPESIKTDCQRFLSAVGSAPFSIEEISGDPDYHLADFVRLFSEDYLS